MSYHYTPQSPTSKTGRVWVLGDEISKEMGRKATRSEVVAKYVEEGGNPGTANVQYGYWAKQFDGKGGFPASNPDPSVIDGRAIVRIGADGRVVIPAEMRRAMKLDADGTVTAVIDGNGILTLISRDAAIRQAQAIARKLKKPGQSVVDELIAERRAEADREDNEE